MVVAIIDSGYPTISSVIHIYQHVLTSIRKVATQYLKACTFAAKNLPGLWMIHYGKDSKAFEYHTLDCALSHISYWCNYVFLNRCCPINFTEILPPIF